MKENKTIQNILDIISIQDTEIKELQKRISTLWVYLRSVDAELDNLKQKYNK